jgi:SAM-dependent methyltransferase
MVDWPKPRPELTKEQTAIYEDWNREFSGVVLDERFGWISRFNHDFAASSARPGGRTLELGAGAGTHLPFEPAGAYVAVERSAQVAALIPERPGLEVLVADCEDRLPYEDASFDRVLAIHVLEHLYNLPVTLAEVARVLKSTGVFSVVIPCEGGLAYTLGRQVTARRGFEKRYGVPYEWLIRYDHCNTAREVMVELRSFFEVRRRRFFPLMVPATDMNVVIGLELGLKSH